MYRESCTAKDTAGNTTVLRFERDRDDDEYELEFKKISYNGVQTIFLENELEVEYDEDDGEVEEFVQKFTLREKRIVSIEYDEDNNRSMISTLQPNGTYKKEVVTGTRVLRIRTDRGVIKAEVQQQ